MIAMLGAVIGGFAAICGGIQSVWGIFSSEPFAQWLSSRLPFQVSVSLNWLNWLGLPIALTGLILLTIILRALFSGERGRTVGASPQPYRLFKHEVEDSVIESMPRQLQKPIPPLGLTVESIVSKIHEAPPYQENAVAQSFEGIHVRWEGAIWAIKKPLFSKTKDEVDVELRPGKSLHSIHFTVSIDKYPELKILKRGDRIGVSGTIRACSGAGMCVKLDITEIIFPSHTADAQDENQQELKRAFEIDALASSNIQKNRMERGLDSVGEASWSSDCEIRVKNLYPTQGLADVTLRVLDIVPPMKACPAHHPRTQDTTLRRIQFPFTDIPEGRALLGDQTGHVRIFTASKFIKPTGIGDKLETEVHVTFFGSWPEDSEGREFLAEIEHILTVEVAASGVTRQPQRFLMRFSSVLDEPVMKIERTGEGHAALINS